MFTNHHVVIHSCVSSWGLLRDWVGRSWLGLGGGLLSLGLGGGILGRLCLGFGILGGSGLLGDWLFNLLDQLLVNEEHCRVAVLDVVRLDGAFVGKLFSFENQFLGFDISVFFGFGNHTL